MDEAYARPSYVTYGEERTTVCAFVELEYAGSSLLMELPTALTGGMTATKSLLLVIRYLKLETEWVNQSCLCRSRQPLKRPCRGTGSEGCRYHPTGSQSPRKHGCSPFVPSGAEKEGGRAGTVGLRSSDGSTIEAGERVDRWIFAHTDVVGHLMSKAGEVPVCGYSTTCRWSISPVAEEKP